MGYGHIAKIVHETAYLPVVFGPPAPLSVAREVVQRPWSPRLQPASARRGPRLAYAVKLRVTRPMAKLVSVEGLEHAAREPTGQRRRAVVITVMLGW